MSHRCKSFFDTIPTFLRGINFGVKIHLHQGNGHDSFDNEERWE